MGLHDRTGIRNFALDVNMELTNSVDAHNYLFLT
jgi:hypothetical protein